MICKSTFDAILRISISYNKPIGNGIITALNFKQAEERCGKIKSNKPNKGLEAAKAVMSILNNGPKKRLKIHHQELKLFKKYTIH